MGDRASGTIRDRRKQQNSHTTSGISKPTNVFTNSKNDAWLNFDHGMDHTGITPTGDRNGDYNLGYGDLYGDENGSNSKKNGSNSKKNGSKSKNKKQGSKSGKTRRLMSKHK